MSACGVDVVALNRSIHFGLLRYRARTYRAIYDAVKTPRSDVDCSLSPLPRFCACRLCSYPGQLWLRYPCISPCGSANGHRLMVYRVLSYACFAFVIKYIFNYIYRQNYNIEALHSFTEIVVNLKCM